MQIARKINFTIIILSVVIGLFILTDFASAVTFTPQVEIPGGEIGNKAIKPGAEIPIEPQGTALADYIVAFYNWAIGAIIVIGIVMIMFAGFQWITAAGSAPKITAAKERITSALIGILLAVASDAILSFVNPSLVRLKSLNLAEVEKEEPRGEMLLGGGRCGSEGEGLSSCGGSCEEIATGGIKSSQCQDASPTLTLFFQCISLYNQSAKDKLQLIITSISDDAGLAKCRDSFDAKICAHERNSAHYGYGTKINGSYAADFRYFKDITKYGKRLESLANICYGSFLDETDKSAKHYHLSVKIDDIDKIIEKIQRIEIGTCAEAENPAQCQKVSSICQWNNNQCEVIRKCGLDKEEIKTAGEHVYCCCAEAVGVDCEYVSSMPPVTIVQKICDVCGGGFPYEQLGLTNCEQYPHR